MVGSVVRQTQCRMTDIAADQFKRFNGLPNICPCSHARRKCQTVRQPRASYRANMCSFCIPGITMLDPQAQALLNLMIERGVPPTHTLSPQDARRFYLERRAVTQPPPRLMAEVCDLTVARPGGDIALRLYRPGSVISPSPTLVYFHGGGWTMGDLDTHDSLCRDLAEAGDCVVVAVDYRMGPEHRFPAAVDDVLAATRWLQRHAETLRLNPRRFAVGGDSAGGNLAAVLALAISKRMV